MNDGRGILRICTLPSMTMNLIADSIQQQGFLVLDGALATELEHHGADLDDPLWSASCLIQSPELIRKVHSDYLLAGADVITSATYQASVKGFQLRGLDVHKATALLSYGVELAIEARDDFWSEPENRQGRLKPLVAVSMGPFGACLHDGSEYHGNYAVNWAEVKSFHRSRLDVLTAAGADLLAFETIPSGPEAEILLDLLVLYPEQHAWLSFSCKDEIHVSHGERFRDCVKQASLHSQLAAVGVNCTAPVLITGLLNSATGLDCPLLVYPNSGESWVAENNCWVGQGVSQQETEVWFQAGALLIGGCCRTGPADTARIRTKLLALVG